MKENGLVSDSGPEGNSEVTFCQTLTVLAEETSLAISGLYLSDRS